MSKPIKRKTTALIAALTVASGAIVASTAGQARPPYMPECGPASEYCESWQDYGYASQRECLETEPWVCPPEWSPLEPDGPLEAVRRG